MHVRWPRPCFFSSVLVFLKALHFCRISHWAYRLFIILDLRACKNFNWAYADTLSKILLNDLIRENI